MILVWLVAVLIMGGILAWAAGRWSPQWPRWISALAIATDLVLIFSLWLTHIDDLSLSASTVWLTELKWNWIPGLGANFHLAADGLSLLLTSLTLLLGFLSVLTSWTEIRIKVGFFHFHLLWVLAGIIGVFLAMDLFLFYFFWELMLVPMAFLIGIWGHENRTFAAYKFFLFTQAGGLAMLVSILALYFVHGRQTGVYTFDYPQLLGMSSGQGAGVWIMLGFVLAFLVKAAVVPVHSWLPDAHTQAPTAGSVILAGLLLKTGAYGLLRFVLPLFPAEAKQFAPVGMALGAIGILYGAKLAFAQNDLKRLIAYTSVSHMGFVMVGIFAFDTLALEGAVLQMVCHGVSTGALFILAGFLQLRLQTRDMNQMGGLWDKVPRLAAASLIFALASLGLPGMGNFVSEFLVLAGTFRTSMMISILASLGVIASTIYGLSLVQRVFHGRPFRERALDDLNPRELVVIGLLVAIIVWLGIFPQPALNSTKASLVRIQNPVSATASARPDNSIAATSRAKHAERVGGKGFSP